MSTTHVHSAECAVCQRHISLLSNGRFQQRGPKRDQCLGTYRTPQSAATLILPALSDAQLDMMRECWRVGDWRPIELEFGIACPQYNLRGTTPEEELADLIADVRHWISILVDLSRSHAARRVP